MIEPSKKYKQDSLEEILVSLKHYLPAQAPLKDFVHHNTLQSFADLNFHEALQEASKKFGYKLYLNIDEYQDLWDKGVIANDVLTYVIAKAKGNDQIGLWSAILTEKAPIERQNPVIGLLRAQFDQQYRTDLNAEVHSLLFRLLGSYLDQGISIWNYPYQDLGFLASLRKMSEKSWFQLIKSPKIRQRFLDPNYLLEHALKDLVGNEAWYESYLFGQQFAHPGWSGMVAVIEQQPQSLLNKRTITLAEVILFECLLEMDALEGKTKGTWQALDTFAHEPKTNDHSAPSLQDECLALWQEAYEWSYYNKVLSGITNAPKLQNEQPIKSTFQAFFCIDDRECSIRRHIEVVDPNCETFGTPGHFGLDFYFQPENSRFYTQVCPAPISPKYLIKEEESTKIKHQKDATFSKGTHRFFGGYIISQTMGWWSAVKLFAGVFKPTLGPTTASSFNHMDKYAKLRIEHIAGTEKHPDGLQLGYTLIEMADRVESVLKSVGLTSNFAKLVYLIGHGSTSVNNTHYAGYDCGACSGRPGSANAKAFAFMANHATIREMLVERGITITETTHFIGGLHDTARDEMVFYDEQLVPKPLQSVFENHKDSFQKALEINAVERAQRFDSVNKNQSSKKIHEQVKERTVSLFEPRPELNHATNALCVVGRRSLTRSLNLNRRAFMNSYDPMFDTDGRWLEPILNAAAPVCGGINLEYYFSRVDNRSLGAGSKLPHNVMGLIGVANGIDGDLQTGLPSQMIELHPPMRLMMIVEQKPEVVLSTIQRNANTYAWFNKNWVHLVVIHPETKQAYVFEHGAMKEYEKLSFLDVVNYSGKPVQVDLLKAFMNTKTEEAFA